MAAKPDQVWSTRELRGNPHRTADKADRIERMFTSIARRYDLNNRLHSLWRDQAWRRRAVEMAGIASSDAVLDMACGTGDLTEALCDARPASVLGVDFTQAMLDIARIKAERRRRGEGVPTPQYHRGDATDIACPDGSQDVVTIAFGIRNVSDPARALAEFSRVLRPGGRLVILEFSTPTNPIARAMNALYTRHIMPFTATMIARDRSRAYHYLPRSVSTFAHPAALRAAVEAHDLAVTQQTPMTLGMCTITVAVRG